MRKGRGLVDMDIIDELTKVPGMKHLIMCNTTNIITSRRTGKLRAEIHEDAWPEVKAAVANWKRVKAGKPQKDPASPKSSVKKKRKSGKKNEAVKRVAEQEKHLAERLANLKPGDDFVYRNVGFGMVTYERGSDAIEVRDGKLFTETFSEMGMDWNGETWKFYGGGGLVTTVLLPEQVPPGEDID
jgi:hypothetical protein